MLSNFYNLLGKETAGLSVDKIYSILDTGKVFKI